ncbi:FadR/GntR family transcriptional regulator [Nitratireductor sp. ZSWI3]|uniref:FadR/GntR family transcriptional regulator n=1 Tax=Nitratireductor sp. ZSWI3 TaxID=2966359 RepID=UPI00214FAB29|nr:FCD domain-containing protein [Nitratireductor sp. ZSWI3]MCR4265885.1 FCD domain-containing protein [Nitratireductor sp. ZSWI3]
MPDPDPGAPTPVPSQLSAVLRRRKRPDIIADKVREMIVAHRLAPGDRVPSEWLSPQSQGASRGTLREALKILEIQGLTTSKTGPGGGVFVSGVGADEAIRLLDNLFLFHPPSIADIYAIRKELEPLLAASVAGKLSSDAFAALQETIRLYEDEPKTAEEEYGQRLAELDFHVELARRTDNALLGFLCTFLVSLLRDMTACRAIYREANPTLRETGLNYQIRLLRAIKAGDAERARQIMREHMATAEAYMLERAEVVRD